MKKIHVLTEEWRLLKQAIIVGDTLEQPWVVFGSPEQIAIDLQAIQAEQSSLLYFLCSSGAHFQVPCYKRLGNGEESLTNPRALGTFLVDEAGSNSRERTEDISYLYALIAAKKAQGVSLLLIECLTPPTEKEKGFFKLAITAAMREQLTVGIFIHQIEPHSYHQVDAFAAGHLEELMVLYLCGNCIREQEWRAITGKAVASSVNDAPRLFSLRMIDAKQWLCYASTDVAQYAESCFKSQELARKQALIKRVLQVLPMGTYYPFLEIASHSNDLQSLLRFYSLTAIKSALDVPERLLPYFDALRRCAYEQGNERIAGEANINYIAALLYLNVLEPLALYQRLEGTPILRGEGLLETHLWFTLGQCLARMKNTRAWEYASVCFERCRQGTLLLEQIDDQQVALRLAAIENGEALVAYKQKQGEKAQQLESSALKKMEHINTSPLKFHLLINLGKLYRTVLHDTDAAIEQYQAAFNYVMTRLHASRDGQQRAMFAAFLYSASLHLEDLLLSTRHYQEAITCLEQAETYLSNMLDYTGISSIFKLSNLRIHLAQIYLQANEIAKAQESCRHIIETTDWFPLEELKGIVSRLACHDDAINQPFLVYASQTISKQEENIEQIMSMQCFFVEALEEVYTHSASGSYS